MESIHIRPEREREMLEELSRMATRHVDASDGKLELLATDPEKYPGQRAFHLEGQPQAAAVVESLATVADPRFPQMQEVLEEAETRHGEVSRLGEVLKAGNNVVVATNHGDLIDVALAQAAIYCALNKRNYALRSGIIISKMVSMLGYKLGADAAPAAEVLKVLCDDVYLSFPRTDTMRRSEISRLLPDAIQRHNRQMTHAVAENLEAGGNLLAIAVSGTVDKPDQWNEDVIRMGRVGQGTVSLVTHRKNLAVPIAVWLHEDEAIFEVGDVPRALRDEASVHQMMAGLATTLTEKVPGKQFIYTEKWA